MNMSTSIPVSNGRVAVLVDCENISCRVADEVLQRVNRVGEPVVRRVYGNPCVVGQWESQPGFNFVHTGSGKNPADVKLAVDAMELSYSERTDRFVIVTSDGDFTHLAYALRERGLYVLGLGMAQAPERYRKACTAFVCLTIPESPAVEKPQFDVARIKTDGLTNRHIQVIGQEDSGGVAISTLNAEMRRLFGIKISDYAEKTWRGYLAKRTDVHDAWAISGPWRLAENVIWHGSPTRRPAAF